MGYSRYIGRVGALAVMLGVGAAVATPGIAWAEDGEGSAPSGGADSSQESSGPESDPGEGEDSSTGSPSGESGEGQPSSEDDEDESDAGDGEGESDESNEGEEEVGEGDDEVVVSPGGDDGVEAEPVVEPSDDESESEQDRDSYGADAPDEVDVADVEPVEEATVESPGTSAPSTPTSAPAEQPVVVVAVDEIVVQTLSAPAEVISEPAPEAATVLTSLFSPSVSGGPEAPVDSPLLWALFAAARREVGSDAPPVTAVQPGVTGAVDTSQMVTVAAAVVANDPPTVAIPVVSLVEDPVTGTVTGKIVGTDPEGKKTTVTVTVKPTDGTFTYTAATGAFTYKPTAAQRFLAGTSSTPDDHVTITVIVSDGVNKVTQDLDIRISPTRYSDLGSIPLGGAVGDGVAVTNIRAYVIDSEGKRLIIVDTIKRTVVGSATLDHAPISVAVTPDGKKVYVVDDFSHRISVFDGATGAALAPIDFGTTRYPKYVSVSPDGTTLYAGGGLLNTTTGSFDAVVTKVSTATGKITGTVKLVDAHPNGFFDIQVTPDGKRVYAIASGNPVTPNRLYVFNSTATTSKLLAEGTYLVGLAITSDSTRMYINDVAAGELVLFDAKTDALMQAYPAQPGRLGALGLSRDGSVIHVVDVVANGAYNIVGGVRPVGVGIVPVGSVTTSAKTSGYYPAIAFSPDGHQMYYTADDGLRVISLVPVNALPVVGAPTPGAPVPATGAVTGGYGVSDPDGDRLSYVLKSGPAQGKVVLNANGTWTYTPTALARHAAAASPGLSDSFVVTVSDGRRGVVEQTVSVLISATNKDPVIKQAVGAPNASTGTVVVTVSATDANRDALTYNTITNPAQGVVPTLGTVSGANGKYVYTPTDAARHAAAMPTGPKTDRFTVVVSDQHGSVQTVVVTVKILPKNIAPNSSGSIGLPGNGSGVVSGSITPNDGDGDTVTYTKTNTVKGALVIEQATGTFTYTPTAAARAAVRTGGVAAKTEKFTITINDGHGGVDTVTLTAQILAAGNNFPTGGVASISTPPNAATGAVSGKITGATDADPADKLIYSGTATTLRGKVVVTATGAFTYTPTVAARHAAAANGATAALKKDEFTVTVQDGVGGWTTVTVQVDILAKNAAPVGKATVGKPNASTGAVAVTVTGADADKDPLTFSAPTASAKGGTVVTNGNGSYTYTPTAVARYNASVTGAPATDKTDTFTVTINDGHGGVVNQIVTATISPKGKPTNVMTSPGSTSYTEQQSPVVVDGAVALTNTDSPSFTGASATLTAPQTGDALAFTAPTGSGISGSYNSTTGALTLTGTSSVANYQAALRSVTFTSTTDTPALTKTISFVVNNGAIPSVTATKTISITAVNDAPAVVTSAGATSYTEQQGPVVVDGAVTVSDPDSPSLSGATATLTTAQTGDALAFTAPAGSGITGSYNSTTGVLTLTGTSSVANYQTALRSIRFTSTTDAPASSKTAAFVVTSSGTPSALATKTISSTAVNDAPILAGGGNVGAAPNTQVKIVPTVTVTDPDGGNLTGATVAIAAGRQAGADVLALSPSTQNGISGSYNATTGVLTLTGTSSVANYQAALRSITFTNNTATPSEGARTVTIAVTDGALSSNTLTLTTTVRVSHAPVASNDAYSAAEDTVVGGNVLTNDTDSDGDALTAALGTAAAHGIVNLNSNGTFTYTPDVNYHGADSFTYTASDGFVTSNTAVVTLTITPVDDVRFQFTYGSGSEYWTPAAKAALQRAADRISELIATSSPVTMTYEVSAVSDTSLGWAARAGSAFGIPSSPDGYYDNFQKKVTSANHVDANGASADAILSWNFGFTFSYDDSPAFNETDFQSVAMHELMHTFGFNSLANSDEFLEAPNFHTTWLAYDKFLVDQSGARVIGDDFKFKSAYYSNVSGGNGGLYFGGANAVAAYGGPVPLQTGSLAHLRSSTFPYNGAVANRKVMAPTLLTGTILRTLSPVELGMLKDLGYTLAGRPQTTAPLMVAVQPLLIQDGQPVLAAVSVGPIVTAGDDGRDRHRNSGFRGMFTTWYVLVGPFSGG